MTVFCQGGRKGREDEDDGRGDCEKGEKEGKERLKGWRKGRKEGKGWKGRKREELGERVKAERWNGVLWQPRGEGVGGEMVGQTDEIKL